MVCLPRKLFPVLVSVPQGKTTKKKEEVVRTVKPIDPCLPCSSRSHDVRGSGLGMQKWLRHGPQLRSLMEEPGTQKQLSRCSVGQGDAQDVRGHGAESPGPPRSEPRIKPREREREGGGEGTVALLSRLGETRLEGRSRAASLQRAENPLKKSTEGCS